VSAAPSIGGQRNHKWRGGYPFSLLLLLLAWFRADAGAAQLAQAQAAPVEHITLGQSAVPLYGPWKFQVGDSPVDPVTHTLLWATPGFDDSKWETVDLKPRDLSLDSLYGYSGTVPGWTARGHASHWGYAWYRIRVQVEASAGEKLLIEGPPAVDDIYQIFQNGNLLGSFGNFSSSRPVVYAAEPMVFPLPQPDSSGSSTRVLAFRIWMEPFSSMQFPDSGGLRTAPLLGDAASVGADYQLRWFECVRTNAADAVLAGLFGLLGIVALCLTFFDPSDRMYLWLGAVYLMSAIYDLVSVFSSTSQYMSFAVAQLLLLVVLRPLVYAGWVMVWRSWFQLDRPSWLPPAAAMLALLYAVSVALSENLLLFTLVPHQISAPFGVMRLVIKLLFLALTVLCVVQSIRREGLEGWSILPAIALWGVSLFWNEFNFRHIHLTWFPFGVQVILPNIADLLLTVVIAGLLLRRLLVTVRRQRLMELDVRQAQEVQRVILPEPIATLPGLAIESEYRPAREVGGDFFQILPHTSDGSMLIVAGDVAGKGLQAGMLVALLVGAIRTSAQFDPDPLAVLSVLNQRLWGRSQAFATCLALRIAADGEATLANAGHLPPYLNGQPMEIEGSLPLGMIEDAECSVMHFRLAKGDRLLLMSDGIAEATDANGKLFGFERIHDLLRESGSAAELASAAQNFGQEDDISVIAIIRTAA
jgi:Stage II sporulation protein E (SpoIIE)